MFTDNQAGSSTSSDEPARQIQPEVTPIPEAYPNGTGQYVAPYPAAQGGGVVDATGQPTTWATEPYGPYGTYGNYGPYGMLPGLPPLYGETGGGRPNRRRAYWKYVLALVALAVTLAGGVALGRASVTQQTGTSTTFGSSGAPVVSVSSNVSSLQQTVETVAKAVAPSVVEITSSSSGQEAIGSGDILTKDGYIVTNDHVVDGFSSYTVTLSNGTKLPAQLVGQDAQDDLAVIKVSATNLQPIAFADSSKLTVGQFSIAIGNPLGLRETATFGVVSALNRVASESPNGPASVLTGLVQTSAPIAPGNSGGALVNIQGQLIGIPTLGETSQQSGQSSSSTTSIGLAIPSNLVKTVTQQLIQSGHVTSAGHGFLGIKGQDVTPAVASANRLSVQSGVLIMGFANDAAGQSPAQQAGVQSGDVIVAVDGQAVADSTDIASAVTSQAPGKQVTLSIVRGSSHLTITVTLGARPSNA